MWVECLSSRDHSPHCRLSKMFDLIILSCKSGIVKYVQVPDVSRRDLVYCVVSFKWPKPKFKYIIRYLQEFQQVKRDSLLIDISRVPWNVILDLTSVDDIFNTSVSNIYSQHTPVVAKRITKTFPVPWRTKDILSLMARRDFLFRKARKFVNNWTLIVNLKTVWNNFIEVLCLDTPVVLFQITSKLNVLCGANLKVLVYANCITVPVQIN